jgi:hypothetical protein
MKSIIAALIFACALPALALADTPAKKPSIGECSAKTKGMSKDEASKFKSDCMKGLTTDAAPAPAKKPTIGECSAKTKGMSKDEASKFKSECMKG